VEINFKASPIIAIIVPCFNEENVLLETSKKLGTA
jgi:glycosyltransferase involved in cell wall biosynthesis